MKILMGNNTLRFLAGSETWTQTLAKEFKRLGHYVTLYSPVLGIISNKLEEDGIKCVNELKGNRRGIGTRSQAPDEAAGDFDVIICSHHHVTKYLHMKYPNIPIISTVHGLIHEDGHSGKILSEHPVTEFRVDRYISVSEEVRDLLLSKYSIESKIIRNFFDLDRFKKRGNLPDKPRTILVNSNNFGKGQDIYKTIKQVAQHYNAIFFGIGYRIKPVYDTENIVKFADIVFGIGRSVLEGACMGKIGIVHGMWGTGGVLTPGTYKTLRKTNFSGRKRKAKREFLSPREIIAQIDAAWNQKNVDVVYEYIKKNHNVKVAAKEFIKIAEELIDMKTN